MINQLHRPQRPAAHSSRPGTPVGAPAGLRRGPGPAGRSANPAAAAQGIAEALRSRSPRLARTLPTQILTALAAQTFIVPGTSAFGTVIAGDATPLRDTRQERATLAADLEARLEAFPLAQVLTSMPGLGVQDRHQDPHHRRRPRGIPQRRAPGRLRRIIPVTRRSDSSIRGETRSQGGNHALKSALFLSAFASLADPTSRVYYDRKRAEGKRHNAALICLARRRVDVIYAMLRDHRPYQAPRPTTAAPVAAAA